MQKHIQKLARFVPIHKLTVIAAVFAAVFCINAINTPIAHAAPVDAGDSVGLAFYSCSQADWDNEVCYDPYNSTINTNAATRIANGSAVSPGDTLIVAMTYSHVTDIAGIQAKLSFDTDNINYLFSDSIGNPMGATTQYGGPYPCGGASATCTGTNGRQTSFKKDVAKLINDSLVFIGSYSIDYLKPITASGELVYFFLEVKDTAPSNTILNFDYLPAPTDTSASTVDGEVVLLGNENAFLCVGSCGDELSSDNSLSSLSITNDTTTYPTSPVFTAGQIDNGGVYTATVPANISAVDLEIALTNAAAGHTLSPNPITLSLNTGNNTKSFSVTAADGTIQNYTINIYRLSSNALLSDLALSDINLSPPFNASMNNYVMTALYATTSTTITATKSDGNKATLTGDGLWDLTNYGATANTRTVTVSAENCKEEYAAVPGNTCSQESYNLTVNRADPSGVASLSDLRVNSVVVDGFSSSNYGPYTLESVPYATTSINITATTTDSNATIISGTGTQALSVGDNTFQVIIIAEDGTSSLSYSIKIRRKSNDTTIGYLAITSSPAGGTTTPTTFNPATRTYTYATTDDAIDIVALPSSSVTILSGTGTNIPISKGQAPIQILTQAEDGNTSFYTIIIDKQDSISDDSSLMDLRIDGTQIADFAPTTLAYTLTVPYATTSLDLTAIPASSTASAAITGNSDFKVAGPNIISITVTAEDSSTTTYTITVTREPASTNADLSDLSVNGVTVTGFDPTTLTYTLSPVNNSTSSIQIGAVAADQKATITGATGLQSLDVGDNSFQIIVTAEDSTTTRAYMVYLRRQNNVSSLTSLTVESTPRGALTPAFNPTVTAYTYSVDTAADTATITATPASGATVITDLSSPQNIPDGATISIIVQSESGDITVYTVNISKYVPQSDDATLSDISIAGATISGFSPDVFNYTYTVPYSQTSLVDLVATPASSSATVELTGNANFAVGSGNIVTFHVLSEDGSTESYYTIDVTRAATASTDATLSDLSANGVTVTGFDSATLTYDLGSVAHSTSSIDLAAVATDPNATLTGATGTQALTAGDNTFTITVTAEDGTTTNTYSVSIHRNYNTTTLASLELTSTPAGELFPAFSPTTQHYTYSVPSTATHATVAATPSDNATIISGTGTFPIAEGGVLNVLVQSEDGDMGFYSIIIATYAVDSTDATLSDISVAGETILGFSSDVELYSIVVPYSETSLTDLVATPTDSNATVSITGNADFVTDAVNPIAILVTAEDGITEKAYVLEITRLAASDLATLSNLAVDGATVENFAVDNFGPYDLGATSADSINISAVASDPNATVSGATGTQALTIGDNTFEVTVTAEDGATTETYSLTIYRNKNTTNLSTLDITSTPAGELSPVYDIATRTYTYNVPNTATQATVAATAADNATIISGTGTFPISNGTVLTIILQSEDGNIGYYTINVTTYSVASDDATLSDLTIGGTTITGFASDITTYTLTVPHATTSLVDLVATPTDSNATVVITGNADFTVGSNNTVTIMVTAEDAVTTETYTITVTREEDVPPCTGEDCDDAITSDQHVLDDTFIHDAVLDTTAVTFLTEFNNPASNLELWNAADTEKIADSAPVATGHILKLIIDGAEVDRRILVVKGDINGDGYIDVLDLSLGFNHAADVNYVTEGTAYYHAADINSDTYADVLDLSLIFNYVSDINYDFPAVPNPYPTP